MGKAGPIRMLTVTAMNLVAGEEGDQLSLFDGEQNARHERSERIEQAVTDLRDRFGAGAVVRGAVIGNDLGIGGAEAADRPHHKEGGGGNTPPID